MKGITGKAVFYPTIQTVGFQTAFSVMIKEMLHVLTLRPAKAVGFLSG
jgi:hypothetical protein